MISNVGVILWKGVNVKEMETKDSIPFMNFENMKENGIYIARLPMPEVYECSYLLLKKEGNYLIIEETFLSPTREYVNPFDDVFCCHIEDSKQNLYTEIPHLLKLVKDLLSNQYENSKRHPNGFLIKSKLDIDSLNLDIVRKECMNQNGYNPFEEEKKQVLKEHKGGKRLGKYHDESR